MAKQRAVFEINGKTYYSPKAAAGKWNISYQAVTNACKDGRIVGAFIDSTNQWCIPDIAMKPLDKKIIRKILIITLYLKNNPLLRVSELDNYDISKLYIYLKETEYIKSFDEESDRIPYEVVLTDKGMDLVLEKNRIKIDWANISTILIQCIPSFLEIGVALSHI